MTPRHTDPASLRPDIQAMNWLEGLSRDHNRLGLLIIRAYQDDGFELLVRFIAWLQRKHLLRERISFFQTQSLSPAEGPSPSAILAADELAAAWLKRHIAADPDLAELFNEAAATSWQPLLRFTVWAIEHGLLSDVRTPHAYRRAS